MSHLEKYKEFEVRHQEALSSIERFRTEGNELSVLVEWLLNTDCNPYSFLTEEWAGSLSNAQSFNSLVRCLSIALYDDGDITFVKVNEQPRIVFCGSNDIHFRDVVLSAQDKKMESWRGVLAVIEVLDCSPSEFCRICDEHQLETLRRCFSMDAGRLGEDFAVKQYSKYNCFDETWLGICKEKIDKWKRFYKK